MNVRQLWIQIIKKNVYFCRIDSKHKEKANLNTQNKINLSTKEGNSNEIISTIYKDIVYIIKEIPEFRHLDLFAHKN